MQDQFPQLDAPEHHTGDMDRPVVPESSLRVIKEVHVEVMVQEPLAGPRYPGDAQWHPVAGTDLAYIVLLILDPQTQALCL